MNGLIRLISILLVIFIPVAVGAGFHFSDWLGFPLFFAALALWPGAVAVVYID